MQKIHGISPHGLCDQSNKPARSGIFSKLDPPSSAGRSANYRATCFELFLYFLFWISMFYFIGFISHIQFEDVCDTVLIFKFDWMVLSSFITGHYCAHSHCLTYPRIIEEFQARTTLIHTRGMPLVLCCLTQPMNNTECSAVFRVSRVYASIYLDVVYIATFCYILLKNLDSILLCSFPLKYTQNMQPQKTQIALSMVSSSSGMYTSWNFLVKLSNIRQILNKGS